jgi:hypothetical protein
MKFVALAALPLLLSACGVPSGLMVATYAIDSASYVGTGKTVSGHAISAATKKDCSVLYGLTRGQLCEDVPVEQPAVSDTRVPDRETSEKMIPPVMLGDASLLNIDDSFTNLETVKTSVDHSTKDSAKPAARPSQPIQSVPTQSIMSKPVETQLFTSRLDKPMKKSDTPLWMLVLGTFDSETSARALLKRLKPVKGLITVSVIDGKVAYRVSTHSFKISEAEDHKTQVEHLELTDIHVSRVCPDWMRDDRCVVLERALSYNNTGLK